MSKGESSYSTARASFGMDCAGTHLWSWITPEIPLTDLSKNSNIIGGYLRIACARPNYLDDYNQPPAHPPDTSLHRQPAKQPLTSRVQPVHNAAKMVQLVEVEDEHFQESQPGPEEEDDFTDTGRLSSHSPAG